MKSKKFLFAILLSLFFSVSALAQNVTVNMQQEKLGKVLDAITDQTGYAFYYSRPTVNPDAIVTLNVKGQSVSSVLSLLFKGTNITYRIDGRKVYLVEMAEVKEIPIGHSVSGKVFDEKGKPFPGATVMIKGTQYGVLSSADGSYSIQAKPEDVIVVSCLGYNEKEALVGSKSVMDFTLTEQALMLDDLVVVGYGTQKRSSLSGSVATIDGEELNSRPVVSAANALQGADPSVNITFGTGSPESGYNINIRGSISLNGGSPLILADGVEVSLSQINPNDIESVSVLKDASTCAIYGAKASAGVVLITTKTGKKDSARINYNYRYGWASNTTSTDFLSTGYDHVLIVNQFMNDSSDGTMNIFRYTEENGGLQKLLERRNDKTENPDRPWTEIGSDGKYYYYGNFDWYGFFYNRVRPQQEHNLSVSGGNGKITYYASGRYYDQYGLFNITEDEYKDYSFRTKVSADVTKWLKYSNNVSYNSSGYTYGGNYNYETTIASLQSNICSAFLPYNPDGTIVQYVNQLAKNSPLGAGRAGQMAANRNKNSKGNSYLTLSNQIDIMPMKGLTITASYDFRKRDRLYKYRNNTFQYSRSKDILQTFTSGSVYNSYREVSYGYKDDSYNVYGTYQNSWNNHNFKIVAGGQYEQYRSTSLDIEQTDLSNDDINSFAVATGTITLSQSISAYKTLGFFARLNYDWKGRYIFEASARADGSSRFAPDSRWGFFPSASAAWRLSDEPFFLPLKGVINNLKLRLSLGSLGNQQVSDYAYIEQITSDNTMSYTFDGISNASYSSVSDPISSGLTWETVSTYNAGLDLSFFKGRLTATADYYVRDTRNMLTTSLTLPDVYGANTPKANCANLRTNGWEVAMNWKDDISVAGKPFSYNVGFALGDYLTKITKYHNPDKLLSNYYEGQTLGDIWGYHVIGLFKTDREAAEYQNSINDKAVNSRLYQGKGPAGNYLRAGDVHFADINGDKIITQGSGTLADHGDLIKIGNSLPRYNYSIRVGADWLGFDFSAFFQGVGKRDWYPPSGQAAYDFWGPYAFPPTSFIQKSFYDNCWSEDNRNAYFPRPRGYNAYSSGSLGTVNDRYIQNLAYLRLKNLTLGYSLPNNLIGKIGLSRVRVYFTGENLYYWSPLKKHNKTIDPELAGSSSTSASYSGTGYSYPRTISAGIDVTF